jgi:F-type H+-transporting ATPase subunit beta
MRRTLSIPPRDVDPHRHRFFNGLLEGCERILRDEFKDYPESALYMIGTIGEAKGKANPVPPAAAVGESKRAAESDPKPAPEAPTKAAPETKPRAEARSKV